MEELTDNPEEPDEAESKQSEVKLGKLQYKVRDRTGQSPSLGWKHNGIKLSE